MSNKSNKTLMASIFQYIGLAFTLFSVFSGTMYITKGEKITSGFIALIFVILSFFLIDQMIKRKETISKQKISSLSISLWSLFLIITTPASLIMYHFINVEMNAKEEVIALTNQKISDIDKMMIAYEIQSDEYIGDYQNRLEDEFSDYGISKDITRLKEGFGLEKNNIDDITNGYSSVDDIALAKKSQFTNVNEEIKREIDFFKTNYGDVFKNWSRLELNGALYELDNLLAKTHEKLKTNFSLKSNNSEDFIFEFNYNKSQINIYSPLEMWHKFKPYGSSILILLFIILMLLPYILTTGPGKYVKSESSGKEHGKKL